MSKTIINIISLGEKKTGRTTISNMLLYMMRNNSIRFKLQNNTNMFSTPSFIINKIDFDVTDDNYIHRLNEYLESKDENNYFILVISSLHLVKKLHNYTILDSIKYYVGYDSPQPIDEFDDEIYKKYREVYYAISYYKNKDKMYPFQSNIFILVTKLDNIPTYSHIQFKKHTYSKIGVNMSRTKFISYGKYDFSLSSFSNIDEILNIIGFKNRRDLETIKK